MRNSEILSEAWRNVASGTSRALALGVTLLLLSAALMLADITAVKTLDESARKFAQSKGAVATIEARGQVDGDVCRALGENNNVRAGAVRAADPLTLDAMPGVEIPAFEVTPGLASILTTTDRPEAAGVFLSKDAAEVIGVTPGGHFVSEGHVATAADVFPYPSDGRKRGYGYAALIPQTPNGVYDECWVEQWPAQGDLSEELRLALVPGAHRQENVVVMISQLNTSLGPIENMREQYTNRVTAWVLPLLAIISIALGSVGIYLRRLELAAALHVGLSRAALLKIVAWEVLIWTLPTLVVTLGLSIYASTLGIAGDAIATFGRGLLMVVAAVTGALIGALTTASTLREENLFDYFKSR